MHIAKISIENFRGIQSAELVFPSKTMVIIGDNNIGKSTILDALDLVLGPERLSRTPIIDEHDFFQSEYIDVILGGIVEIKIEVIVADLTTEQQSMFNANLEWWDLQKLSLVEDTKGENTVPALRVHFTGKYDEDEDDFLGETFFAHPVVENQTLTRFRKSDKRGCGFLYLRALRTGSRALSLERGSLLDIILRLREIRPKMWENVLDSLKVLPVAEDKDLGLSEIFSGIEAAIKRFVPAEWGSAPHLRVSDLTRENLRKTLHAFISTGIGEQAVPFQHQGTGTINLLVLALLSMIAKERKNVIFAMEEPEIAIPPYAQKRIVAAVTEMASQAIFTSHSPYVIEEFDPNDIFVLRKANNGVVSGSILTLPTVIKQKRFRNDIRTRLAESLLSRRVLIVEGLTEALAFSSAARRLAEINPEKYSSLELLGISICDATAQSQISSLGAFFGDLGKQTFAAYDHQTNDDNDKIQLTVDICYMSPFTGAEELIVESSDLDKLREYHSTLVENKEIQEDVNSPVNNESQLKKQMLKFFRKKKGAGHIADFLSLCKEKEMPAYIRETIASLKSECS